MKFRTICAAASVALLLAFAAFSQQNPKTADDKLLEKARAIHERAISIDTHVDIPGSNYDPGENSPPNRKCTLPKMEKGGLKGVFLAVFVGQQQLSPDAYAEAYKQAMAKFEAAHNVAEKLYPNRCAIATTPDEVRKIAKTGKRVLMIGIENGFVIGTDLSLIRKYYDLGARYITLSHGGDNQICDSATNTKQLNKGLSPFGEQVVAEMNRLGIMIDVSHIAEKSFWDVIKVSKAPIIASHSGCSGLNPNPRNLTDEQLKALAKNGGVIQIVALGSYLGREAPERAALLAKLLTELGIANRRQMTPEQRTAYEERVKKEVDPKYPPVSIIDFVNHIDHAVKVAGIDHVGVGTDFDGGGGVPGFNDHSEALNVTVELVKRGYSEKDIDKIWGGNLLRVWSEVEKKASAPEKSK
jgi:microsomal dipeptidase-like Zn-dependent dipeptidase